jgi:uncharacterized membrane protein YkvA (DUF1232 family)
LKIRSVSDLQEFMRHTGRSPEALAKELKLSNMTIRRLLKKAPDTLVADKYHSALDSLSVPSAFSMLQAVAGGSPSSFAELIKELERSGGEVADLEKLKTDVEQKNKDVNIGWEIKEKVSFVLKGVFSKDLPLKYKALCVGAILYFINPIDLIPDSIPIIGYLDDFAVLTLVMGIIMKAKNPPEKEL